MLLTDYEQSPQSALEYAERYVNDGSPSGFTERFRPSIGTDPFGTVPGFCLYAIDHLAVETFGQPPSELPGIQSVLNSLVVHPDMRNHIDLAGLGVRRVDELTAVPTSSGRTVQLNCCPSRDYVKLHYDGVLGRINRRLTYKKAVSGVEMSSEVENAILTVPELATIALFRETSAQVLWLGSDERSTWGVVWRASTPSGRTASLVSYTVPLFALWSRDRLRPHHEPLIVCIARRQPRPEWIHEQVIRPLVDFYFELIASFGLQFEMNAQNILVGFDRDWRVVALIVRDMMGIEKDLTLRTQMGLPIEFGSSPYKCISAADGDLYSIRHSFAFDFKLSLYVLRPLIQCAAAAYGKRYDEGAAVRLVRDHVATKLFRLPRDFFPGDGGWYRHGEILLTGPRSYIAEPGPFFR